MAKASPAVRSFNAGEFSDLMQGRTDLDRYPASLKSLVNFIAAPQGPALARSGTELITTAADEAEKSALVPFTFSNEEAFVVEFGSDRLRFMDEDGLLAYPPVAATVTSAAAAAMEITSVGLDAEVGDQVSLSGFPNSYNLNGRTANVLVKSGDDYELDVVYPNEVVVPGTVARIYHVAVSHTEAERFSLRTVQSADVVYLMTGDARPRKLSRYSTYDWRIEDISFVDGPFMDTNATPTTLTPSATGNPIPVMTSDTTPFGEASASSTGSDDVIGDGAGDIDREPWHAFDEDDTSYWAADTRQEGFLAYEFAAPTACDAYIIYIPKRNDNVSYTAKDHGPSSWTFEGFDGSEWVVLDRQNDYVLYDGYRSVMFQFENSVAYEAYRLVIGNLTRNGDHPPRISRLVLRETGGAAITLTASSAVGINGDTGFQPTDVGRLIRVRSGDQAWRSCEIVTVTSATEVDVTVLGDPLYDLTPMKQWRLGFWSDTTGWPQVADFLDDRLWFAGPAGAPDMFAASVTGDYEVFSQTDPFGVVLDDGAIVRRLNARKISRIRWLASDHRGLLMGTGSEEYAVSAPNNDSLTQRNMKARPTTRRGSANVEPVRVDNQILYAQRGSRAVRELAFVFEADGYKSPSMSQLASHIGAETFVRMEYAAEPHSIVWMLRADGSLVGLTYNREENVIGWHQQNLSDGVVEDMVVLPQKDQLQDALWVSILRDVDGVPRRFIERLTRFWDFGASIEDAHFVDSALRYDGVATSILYGMQHLEGVDVYGLADGKPVGPHTVVNGSVTIPYEAERVLLGLGFDAVAEIPRIEAGAEDGTSQGKSKRVHGIVAHLWSSFGGQIGLMNKQKGSVVWDDLTYPGDYSQFEELELYTGLVGPVTPSAGYDQDGIMAFRRPKENPLPFNMVAMYPQLNTQDR